MKAFYFFIASALLFVSMGCSRPGNQPDPTTDNGERLILKTTDLKQGPWHTIHAQIFGKYVDGYNRAVLEGIDRVQAHSDSGGGYFIGITADPPESPVGYPLQLLGRQLVDPPRSTSYCSGSSFAAFMEGMNLILGDNQAVLDDAHYEALRMQETDGGRREDHVKFWGKWNADGYGNHFALVQYTGIGRRVTPLQARPGDFMNISWKNGGGHSVVFLGWVLAEDGTKKLAYWSSQTGTNGFGDQVVSINRIKEVLVVRLQEPERLLSFNLEAEVNTDVKGDIIAW